MTWYIWSQIYLLNGTKSCAQDGYAKLKTSLTWWHPQLIKNWKKGFGFMKAFQAVSIWFMFWSWVDRKAVLLRGMHHDHRLILSSAQVNPCEVIERLTWELNSMCTCRAYQTCPVWVLLCILTFWDVMTKELFRRVSALPAHVSKCWHVGSSDVRREFRRRLLRGRE